VTRRLALVACMVGLVAGAAACGDDGATPAAPSEPPPVDLRDRAAVEVLAKDNFFEPQIVIVRPGTRLTWRNVGAVVHNVKKSSDLVDFGAPFGVNQSDFAPGDTYAFTFARAGVFHYICTIHTAMTGSVRVEAVSTPTSRG
jgi:plastocyanin